MSIVEKTITKLRTQSGDAPAGERPQPEGRPFKTGEVAKSRSIEADRQQNQPQPASTVKLDLAVLRQMQMISPADQQRRLTDEVRRIKWPLLKPLMEAPPGESAHRHREIMVTSAVPSEGKTFVILNLALSIAREKDCSVLLVDADLAKPHLTTAFGLRDHIGLTDILADESLEPFSAVLATNLEGLWFLPAGRSNSRAPELVASQRMAQVIGRIRACDPRRIALFDCPPLLASNEAQALSHHVENILMVVRAESTSPAVVADARRMLDETKQLSYVLNRAPRSTSTSYYGSYYGYEQENNGEQHNGETVL